MARDRLVQTTLSRDEQEKLGKVAKHQKKSIAGLTRRHIIKGLEEDIPVVNTIEQLEGVLVGKGLLKNASDAEAVMASIKHSIEHSNSFRESIGLPPKKEQVH